MLHPAMQRSSGGSLLPAETQAPRRKAERGKGGLPGIGIRFVDLSRSADCRLLGPRSIWLIRLGLAFMALIKRSVMRDRANINVHMCVLEKLTCVCIISRCLVWSGPSALCPLRLSGLPFKNPFATDPGQLDTAAGACNGHVTCQRLLGNHRNGLFSLFS